MGITVTVNSEQVLTPPDGAVFCSDLHVLEVAAE